VARDNPIAILKAAYLKTLLSAGQKEVFKCCCEILYTFASFSHHRPIVLEFLLLISEAEFFQEL
jgi:hypothetical protein